MTSLTQFSQSLPLQVMAAVGLGVIVSAITGGNTTLGGGVMMLALAVALLRHFMSNGGLTRNRLIATVIMGIIGGAMGIQAIANPSDSHVAPVADTAASSQSEQSAQAARAQSVTHAQSASVDRKQSEERLDGSDDEDTSGISGHDIERSGVTASPIAPLADESWSQTVALLDSLAVKGRAPKTGYDRSKFGQRWADVDKNGCDTRNDILGRDLTDVKVKPGTRNCKVLSGTLNDPYTGAQISFTRGPNTSSKVQIDHVVALADAWQKGAQQLSAEQRTAFANDPLNLRAVDGSANQQKGAGDAATWLPKNKDFRCTYVATQIQVKAKYQLWVTQAEKDAMKRVLDTCQPAPKPEPAPEPAPEPEPAPAPEPEPQPEPEPVQQFVETPPAPEPEPKAYYANCAEARAAGAAPLYEGSPGYRRKLDRDGDGVACE